MTLSDPQLFLNTIAQAIFDKKGFNILALDVKDISSLTDYVIIAEGHMQKHVSAIAEAVIERLCALGYHPVRVEGMGEGDWVVIDYLSIMVHLFMPGLRDKYQLEMLFREGHIVDVQINVGLKC